MVAKVFIDGEVGTTGLQIAQRLRLRDDIALISLVEETRKDLNARVDALCQADVGHFVPARCGVRENFGSRCREKRPVD